MFTEELKKKYIVCEKYAVTEMYEHKSHRRGCTAMFGISGERARK